jgi:hypothetical protein
MQKRIPGLTIFIPIESQRFPQFAQGELCWLFIQSQSTNPQFDSL